MTKHQLETLYAAAHANEDFTQCRLTAVALGTRAQWTDEYGHTWYRAEALEQAERAYRAYDLDKAE